MSFKFHTHTFQNSHIFVLDFQVSYVLIVQQPEDKDKGGPEEAIGVYDFENENDFDDGDEDGIDDKTKIRKLKSSQQVIE